MFRVNNPVNDEDGEHLCITLPMLYDYVEDSNRCSFLNSHAKFIAARTIQRFARGWLIRRRLKNLNETATFIQKIYRGHLGWHRYFRLVKEIYEQRIVEYWNYCATLIQAYWRGYWVRKYVHDHSALIRKQRGSAKDLIICVAHKLHYLLRTHQTPGIYSIRNSHCLTKVEQLLSSLKFRKYNERIRKVNEDKLDCIKSAVQKAKDKKKSSKIPYGTPCDTLTMVKMQKTLDKYHAEAMADPDEIKRMNECVQNELARERCGGAKKIKKRNLVTDVVNSMTKLGIVKDDKNFIVPPSIVRSPESIEQFCRDMAEIITSRNM